MNIKAFVLHHTATGTGRLGDGSDIVESIGNYALKQSKCRFRHFYHTMIGPKGHTFSVLPWNTVAPHCGIDAGDPVQDASGVNNHNTVAICCIGNFQQHQMPQVQWDGLLSACLEAKKRFPHAFFKLHRELVATSCPGQYFPHDNLFNAIQYDRARIQDVPAQAWYAKAVQYCLDKGFMRLDEKQKFRPQQTVTRAEMAQVLLNLEPWLKLS